MKKKFINGLLMGALFVGFTSSMVSCKDYDDEKITNLEGVLADNVDALKKALDQQKADLEKQIKEVKTLQELCQKNCSIFKDSINTALKNYLLKTEFQTEMLNYYTKTQIDQKFIDELDKYVRKDALDKSVADLVNKAGTELNSALETYANTYVAINHIINEDSIKALIRDSIAVVNAKMAKVEKLAESAYSLADAANKLAASAQKLAENDSVRIDNLSTELANFKTQVAQDVEKIYTRIDEEHKLIVAAQDKADKAWAYAEANETLIKNLRADFEELKGRVENLEQEVVNLGISIEQLDQKVDQKVQALTLLIGENTKKIESLEETVAQNKAEADSVAKELQKQITGVAEGLQELTERVEENFNYILALFFYVNDVLYKSISDIEINGTYNPMFGQLATSFNIRSGMLVAFRGTIEDRLLNFPSRNSDFYAFGGDPTEVFTDKDLEMLGVTAPSQLPGYFKITKPQDIIANEVFDKNGEIVPTDDQGYAGTIYLTINPTNRDFEGTVFDLYNSQNKKVPVELSPLKKSDHLLTFGYTRANVAEESENGFYETKVTVKPENIGELGLRLKLDELAPVVENFKNWKDGINLTPLVNAIYDNINNVLDANALKATYQSCDDEFSVLSQYAIGVAGIKPLSFAFGKDIILDGIPGSDLAEDLLSNIIDVIVEGLPDMDFINRFDITELRLDELTDELYATITVDLGERHIISTGPKTATFWFPYYHITGINGEHVIITSTHPEVTVTVTGGGDEPGFSEIKVKLYMGDFIAYMGGYDSEPLETIRKQFNQLLVQVNDFVSSITQMNFQNMGNDVFSQFQAFIDELNSHFARFTQPNRFFQPVVIVKNEKGMVHLSTLANHTTKVEGPFIIIPTNYNAEILSPAFKKFIAVTDVWKDGKTAKNGDDDCKKVLDEANTTEGFKQVINGGFKPIAFAGKAGYTYEFLYTAVDYSGQIVTRKYYMTVK